MIDINEHHLLLLNHNREFYPAKIPYSVRMNYNDNVDTEITWPGAGAADNLKMFTLSFWIKRCNLGKKGLFTGSLGIVEDYMLFDPSDRLFFTQQGGGPDFQYITTQVFRDITNWYHFLIQWDTAQATAADRVNIYVNNIQITAFDTENDPSLNRDTVFAINNQQDTVGFGDGWSDQYMAEVRMLDGLIKPPSDFGQTKNGVWVHKRYTGSHGTRGWYLDFSNSSHFGEDQSGNGNDFTDINFAANDQVLDTPTNNYPTLNVIHHLASATLANGNLECSGTENEYATMQIPLSGKWAWQITVSENGSFGLEDIDTNEKVAADVSGEVVEMLCDMDNGTLKKKVDGGSLETIEGSLDTSKEWYPHFKAACSVDFGQLGFTPTEAGYRLLCTKNLPEPTIMKPDLAFDALLYLGNSIIRNVTDLNFQPDLTAIKNRSQADEHKWIDSIRGATLELSSDSVNAEQTDTTGLTAFLSNGFSLGAGANGYNDNAELFVSWNWKIGPQYGFDIVADEGTGAAHAINHNCGGPPELIIRKCRDIAHRWVVYHHHALNKIDPETDYGRLDDSAIWTDSNTRWNDVAPTSTQFTVGTDLTVNEDTKNFINYLWRSIPGFSKVFSYVGNANVDGPYVYCAFRPRYLLIKDSGTIIDWKVIDTARGTYNSVDAFLEPSLTSQEYVDTGYDIDFLSNGFKIRTTISSLNDNNKLHIGIAFAELPGKYSNAR